MPVTGLPVAVEAVLESLLSQYHLISWQVTGGERNVVLTLRWSLGDLDNDRHQHSPTRKPPDRRRSPHRHRHHGRSRRTSQWLQEQQHETPDSTLERPHHHNHIGSDPCDTTPPTSPPVRHRRTNPATDVVDGNGRSLHSKEYYDYDSPPPLPPPPPNLDFSDGSGSHSLASESEADSRTTQDTVIERRNFNPHLRQPVRSDPSSGSNQDEDSLTRRGSVNVKKPEPEGILKNKTVIVTENRTDPVGQAQSQGQSQGQSQSQSETEENSRRRRYHFRELIRKHSDDVKELAAERRRKENERDRLREAETAKAKTRLKAKSEDNLLTRHDDEPNTDSDDNLRAKSEANISKNEDGTRRVRFSSEEGDNTDKTKQDGNAVQGVGKEQGAQGAQGQVAGPSATFKAEGDPGMLPEDNELEAEEEEDDDDDDSEGDSPDADEIGRGDRPRRIGAMFRIGAMVARQRRRRALLK